MSGPISRETPVAPPPAQVAAQEEASAPAQAEEAVGAEATETSEETPDQQDSSGENSPRLLISAGAGVIMVDTGDGLNHVGPIVRAEVGVGIPVIDNFEAQANLYGTLLWAEQDLGFGSTSSLNGQGAGVVGRFGVITDDRVFQAMIEADLGFLHMGAPSCENGLDCGLLIGQNAQLYPVDTTGIRVGAGLMLGVFSSGIRGRVRIGTTAGLNPEVQLLTQPDPPAMALNTTEVEVTLEVDVVSLWNHFTGNGRAASAPDEEEDVPEPSETQEAEEAGPSESSEESGAAPVEGVQEPAPAPVQGMALIQQNLEDVHGESGYLASIRSHSQELLQAYRQFQAARTQSSPDMDGLRILTDQIYRHANGVITAYGEIQERITASNRERISDRVSSAETPAARRAIGRMRRVRSGVQRHVNQSFTRARRAVRQFNRLASEDIEFELRNPISQRDDSSETERQREGQETPTPNPPPAGDPLAAPPSEEDEG